MCTSRNLSLLELQKIPHIASEPRTQLQVSLNGKTTPRNLVQSLPNCRRMASRVGKLPSRSLGSYRPGNSSLTGFANTPSLHEGAPLWAAPSDPAVQAPATGGAQQKGAQPAAES